MPDFGNWVLRPIAVDDDLLRAGLGGASGSASLLGAVARPEPVSARARRTVWVARRKSDGFALAAWVQSVKPDPDTSLPNETGATIEVLEVPRDVVQRLGGYSLAPQEIVGGTIHVDGFSVPRGARDRHIEEVAKTTARGGLIDFVKADLTEKLIKSADGTFWALRVSDAGVLSTTSLGTTAPDYSPVE